MTERPHAEFTPTRLRVKTWLTVVAVTVPLGIGAIFVLAANQESDNLAWPVVASALILLAASFLVLGLRSELTIDASGRLVKRGVRRREVDLTRLADIFVWPPLPVDTSLDAGKSPSRHVAVTDRDGHHLTISVVGPYGDVSPVLEQVVRCLESGIGRCSARCWRYLSSTLGLTNASFPERLTEPGAFDVPIVLHPSVRRAESQGVWGLLAGIPIAGGIMGFVGNVGTSLGMGLTALAGGVIAAVVLNLPLIWQYRLSGRVRVTISESGRLHSVHRPTRTAGRLGLRLHEGAVDLTSLVAVDHVDQGLPALRWVVRLRDDSGGEAFVDMQPPWVPAATLVPHLVHHLETAGFPLNERMRTSLEARLGRTLSAPTLGPLPESAEDEHTSG